MNKIALPWRLINLLLTFAATVSLLGCGTGEGETSTVAKTLSPPPSSLDGEGYETVFDYPSRGTAAKAVTELERAGVRTLGRQCGVIELRDSSGKVLLVAGSPKFVVFVEIPAYGLETAIAAGFVEAKQEYMKKIGEVFDCESRSL